MGFGPGHRGRAWPWVSDQWFGLLHVAARTSAFPLVTGEMRIQNKDAYQSRIKTHYEKQSLTDTVPASLILRVCLQLTYLMKRCFFSSKATQRSDMLISASSL